MFDTALPSGARYDVTIAEQPRDPSQTCSVSNGSGFVGDGNVTNIVVDCVTRDFSVGGRVTRLRGLGGLVIQNNGGDDLQIGADGRFTFPTRLPSGASVQRHDQAAAVVRPLRGAARLRHDPRREHRRRRGPLRPGRAQRGMQYICGMSARIVWILAATLALPPWRSRRPKKTSQAIRDRLDASRRNDVDAWATSSRTT